MSVRLHDVWFRTGGCDLSFYGPVLGLKCCSPPQGVVLSHLDSSDKCEVMNNFASAPNDETVTACGNFTSSQMNCLVPISSALCQHFCRQADESGQPIVPTYPVMLCSYYESSCNAYFPNDTCLFNSKSATLSNVFNCSETPSYSYPLVSANRTLIEMKFNVDGAHATTPSSQSSSPPPVEPSPPPASSPSPIIIVACTPAATQWDGALVCTEGRWVLECTSPCCLVHY